MHEHVFDNTFAWINSFKIDSFYLSRHFLSDMIKSNHSWTKRKCKKKCDITFKITKVKNTIVHTKFTRIGVLQLGRTYKHDIFHLSSYLRSGTQKYNSKCSLFPYDGKNVANRHTFLVTITESSEFSFRRNCQLCQRAKMILPGSISWWKYINFEIKVKGQSHIEFMNVCDTLCHGDTLICNTKYAYFKEQKAVARKQRHLINPINSTLR